jgi:hypothetical protein
VPRCSVGWQRRVRSVGHPLRRDAENEGPEQRRDIANVMEELTDFTESRGRDEDRTHSTARPVREHA